jgi:hypothetical protein
MNVIQGTTFQMIQSTHIACLTILYPEILLPVCVVLSYSAIFGHALKTVQK